MPSDAKNLKQSKPDLKARKGHEMVTLNNHERWAEFIEQIRKELGWTLDETCDFTGVEIGWLKKARSGQNIRGDFREKFEDAINQKWSEKFPNVPPLAWPAWVDGAPWSKSSGNTSSSSTAAQEVPDSTPPKTLAVLPFVNMSPDQENEFLCDGITEDIIIALSRVKGLRVPARTSSFTFKGKSEDIRDIGELLNVATVLEGSVRKSGNKLRITAQLVNVKESVQLWSKRYDRELKDVFDIQDDITRAIVGELQIRLHGGTETQFVQHQTANTTAYELYVKGRVYWNTRGVDLKKALHYFDLALLEDPQYSLAWSGIADAFVLLGFHDFLPCREAMSKARDAAEKAVVLDKHSAEAHSALGVVRLFHDWDLTRSKAELEQALQLNPGNSLARGWLAMCLVGESRDDEALEQARLGLSADPLSAFANMHLAYIYIMLRQFSEAIPVLRHSIDLFPKSPMGHWLLGQALWFKNQRQEALTEFNTAVELSARSPINLTSLGWALAQSGQTARAREIQIELTERASPAPTRPLFLAILHAALGEMDLAFIALEQAFKEREIWLPQIRGMTGLDLLSADKRWGKFVSKIEQAKH